MRHATCNKHEERLVRSDTKGVRTYCSAPPPARVWLKSDLSIRNYMIKESCPIKLAKSCVYRVDVTLYAPIKISRGIPITYNLTDYL